MPSLKHIHRYKRHLKKINIFMCADPACSHYISDPEHLVGKLSLCNKCGAEFVLSRDQLKNLNPVCLNCSKSKKKQVINTATDLLHELFNEVMK